MLDEEQSNRKTTLAAGKDPFCFSSTPTKQENPVFSSLPLHVVSTRHSLFGPFSIEPIISTHRDLFIVVY